MEAIEFVKKLKDRVIENDNKVYQNLLDTTIRAEDPIWNGILPIYKNLDKSQQLAFLQFSRMIQVNTLSHILGVLDGSTTLGDNVENFILKTEEKADQINGYLQDLFLEMEEI
jgi:hypothetical protein